MGINYEKEIYGQEIWAINKSQKHGQEIKKRNMGMNYGQEI